ncbi:MAG: type VI secretion system baseplate subunit TssG [Deltaproteobacteria bacterium]|nr:type VI secretion system baseplate subunit TssG [Deltaproteobacteria bacterium]
MAPEKRQSNSPLADRLFEEFYTFSFFKAVDLLERLAPESKPLGQTLDPRQEAVRFKVRPGLAFAPSDIAGLEPGAEGQPASMDVAFMGLLGPSGVLPHWYNEMAVERWRKKDFSFTSFLDIFHHRLVSLFYLAWKKHQFPATYLPGATDKLSGYLLSLAGLGTKGLRGRIGLPEESLSFYSGLLSRQIPAAVSIESAVSYYAGTTVKVDQFIERMIPLAPEDQTSIGQANAQLGLDTICGSFIWDCQTKFRVNLGPMHLKEFLRFLPTGDLLRPIFSLVRYMVGIEYEFEVRILLRKEEVPPCILGATLPAAPRLGWTTWSMSPGFVHREDPHITFEEEGMELKTC